MATNGAKRTAEETDAEIRVSDALEEQLRALCSEDDFAGGLTVVGRYPDFDNRALSEFEADLRDWGFAYGLAFGLIMRDNPELEHDDAARLAFKPALAVYRRWGGELQNPAEMRERAITAIVRRFDEADKATDAGRVAMTSGLQDAIVDLAQSAKG